MTGSTQKRTGLFLRIFFLLAVLSGLVCVGFAQVTDVLSMQGRVTAPRYHGVMITHVEEVTAVAGSKNIHRFAGSVLQSHVDLGNSNGGQVTVRITVYNTTDEVYGYNVFKYANDAYSNSDVVLNVSIQKRTEVAPHGTLDFLVTFRYKSGIGIPSDRTLDSVVNYEFLPLDEISGDDKTMVSDAMGRFNQILNDGTEYQKLTRAMDNPPPASGIFERPRDTSFIGNVEKAGDSDKEYVQEQFGDYLNVSINGEKQTVSLLIKREDIDGNPDNGEGDGKEMAIYMTTESLSRWRGTVVVYACFFVKDTADSPWRQVGNAMFEGKAPIVGYSGSTLGTGSFTTDEWTHTGNKTYDKPDGGTATVADKATRFQTVQAFH